VRLAAVTLVSLLFVVAFAAITRASDDPVNPVATQTQVVTVEKTYQGKDIHWWAAHAVRARREANARKQTIRTLQAHRGTPRMAGPLTQAFLCIHGFEGSWQDAGAPFWGGLQMDSGFQRTYGREFYRAWGTADHWPPFVQLAVAMRAYLAGRGFGPWPNTSRMCGL
jgi:hypothetical protein